jgi:hypothetical protein
MTCELRMKGITRNVIGIEKTKEAEGFLKDNMKICRTRSEDNESR